MFQPTYAEDYADVMLSFRYNQKITLIYVSLLC